MNKSAIKDKIMELESEVLRDETIILNLKQSNRDAGIMLDNFRQELSVVSKKEEFETKQDMLSKDLELRTQEHHTLHKVFMEKLCIKNQEDVIEGFFEGWWDLDDDGNMAALPKVFKIKDFPENALMAHVMAAAGIFPSVSQARKNGHDKPLEPGLFIVTKKKIRIKVEE